MQAINFLSDWIKYLLLIVPVGAGCTLTYFATQKAFSQNEDDIATYNKKMNITIKAAIVIVSISGVITVVKSFYQ